MSITLIDRAVAKVVPSLISSVKSLNMLLSFIWCKLSKHSSILGVSAKEADIFLNDPQIFFSNSSEGSSCNTCKIQFEKRVTECTVFIDDFTNLLCSK